MLDTLIKIGKWQASKMKPIERFLYKPKLNDKKTYYVLNLVFDLDEYRIHTEIYKKFDIDEDTVDFLLLKTLPGNNKAIYATVEKGKIDKLIKSFFGKIDIASLNNVIHGELYIKAKEIGTNDNFLELLDEITKLKDVLIDIIANEKDDSKLEVKKLINDVSLKKGEDIAAIISVIKSEKFGFINPSPISKIEGYVKFVTDNFLSEDTQESNAGKLCYASGEIKNDVDELKLETRYSLNKMFVTETKNYASLFDKKNFTKNYQISKNNQTYLDIASTHLLNNYKISIAGIPHVMVPAFLSNTKIDFDFALDKINRQSDFLFSYNAIKKIETDITDEIDNEIYWLNFLSIDSDGNYFKSDNLIKDVSKPYFLKIIKMFDKINNRFSECYNSNTFFNFYSFYQYIPLKTGTNKNEALELFKDIFEHRSIDKNILFKYFTKYLIVQRSGQFDNSKKHRANSNIREQSNFDYAIKNGVMNYLAFIQFLKKLNLINNNSMEKHIEISEQKGTGNNFNTHIDKFFKDMGYSGMQKALFYLGRVLGQVAYAQYNKNHKNKPVLNKLNYNGMDKNDIIRLRLDLAEKAKQYNIIGKVEYDFSQFTHLFNPNDRKQWLTREENIFYILSGYSFGMIKEGNNGQDNEDKENKILT